MTGQLVREMLEDLPTVVQTPDVSTIRAEAARRARTRTATRRAMVAAAIAVFAGVGLWSLTDAADVEQVATDERAQSPSSTSTVVESEASVALPQETTAPETAVVEISAGLTVEDMIAQLVEEHPQFTVEGFTAALDQFAVATTALPADADALRTVEGVRTPYEGLFAGGTYDIDLQTSEVELLQALATAMEERLAMTLSEAGGVRPTIGGPGTRALSDYEILTIASLIESEAIVETDQGRVARVLYNRLHTGEWLATDRAVLYVVDDEFDQAIREVLQNADHPYNVRGRPGLPPTPISSPSQTAIEAAVSPAQGEWFWYVLTNEGGVEGAFTFAAIEAEFSDAVALCRERELGC